MKVPERIPYKFEWKGSSKGKGKAVADEGSSKEFQTKVPGGSRKRFQLKFQVRVCKVKGSKKRLEVKGSCKAVSSQKVVDKISNEDFKSSFQVQSCWSFHMGLFMLDHLEWTLCVRS